MDSLPPTDFFTNRQQVAQYALEHGRRELEMALFSGQLTPLAEKQIRDWMHWEDQRRRWGRIVMWGSGCVILACALATFVLYFGQM